MWVEGANPNTPKTSVLKRDRDPESGSGGIGIGNFNLGRDRAGSGLEIST